MIQEVALCRAKRLDNGKWVKGYYVQMPSVNILDLAKTGDPIPDTVSDYIVSLRLKPYQDRVTGQTLLTVIRVLHPVVSETVCRNAGMKDANGVLIFEGDFVRCTRRTGGLYADTFSMWGVVQERCGAFGVLRYLPNLESWQAPYRFHPFHGWMEEYEIEILGNRFNHPRLWARFNQACGPAPQE